MNEGRLRNPKRKTGSAPKTAANWRYLTSTQAMMDQNAFMRTSKTVGAIARGEDARQYARIWSIQTNTLRADLRWALKSFNLGTEVRERVRKVLSEIEPKKAKKKT
jgi:hypothetical protein